MISLRLGIFNWGVSSIPSQTNAAQIDMQDQDSSIVITCGFTGSHLGEFVTGLSNFLTEAQCAVLIEDLQRRKEWHEPYVEPTEAIMESPNPPADV